MKILKRLGQIAGALALTALALPAQAETANIVATYNLEVNQEPNNTYAGTTYPINNTEIMQKLGCSELTTDMLVSFGTGNELITVHTADFGFWYNASGGVQGYGDESAFFIEYNLVRFGPDEIEVGNMPGLTSVNTTCNFGFLYNGNAVKFDVTVNIEEEEIGEFSVVDTINMSCTQVSTSEYESTFWPFDGQSVMSKLGCSDLNLAKIISLNSNNAVIAQNANNGYWYESDGQVGNDWYFYIEYHGNNEWAIGNFPYELVNNAKCNIGFLYNDKAVIFDITVSIKEAPKTSVNVKKTVPVEYTIEVSEDYDFQPCDFDAETVMSELGCSSLNSAMVVSLDEENNIISKNADGIGYWYNAAGEVTTWEFDVTKWCIQYRYPNEGSIGQWWIGNMAGVLETSGKCNIGFVYEGNAYMFEVTVNISEAAYIPEKVEVIGQPTNLTFKNEVDGPYQAGLCTFDAAQVMQLLGCDALTTDMLIALDEDGYVLKHTAYSGYFFNSEGKVCGAGDTGSSWFIEYTSENPTALSIGNNVNVYEVSGTCQVGFAYEGKAVMFNVSVELTKEVISDYEVVAEMPLEFVKTFEGKALKSTIPFNASTVMDKLECESLNDVKVVSLDDEENILDITANNGYWYNEEGEVCKWGEEGMAYFIEYTPGASEFRIGFNGQDVDTKCNIGLLYEGNIVLFNVTVNMAVVPITEFDVVKEIELTYSQEAEGVAKNGTIAFTAADVTKALGCDNLEEVLVVSVADDEVVKMTANNGYWYNFDGEVCDHNTENQAFYIEYDQGASELRIGFAGGNVDTECNIGFYYMGNVVLFNVSVELTVTPIVEFEVVDTIEEEFEMVAKVETQTGNITIDEKEVLEALGCEKLSDATVISLNEEGEVIAQQTANNGYWYNAEGEVTVYNQTDGDQAWYIEYHNDGKWTVGIYELQELEGECNIGFYYGGKAVIYEVSVKVTVDTTAVDGLNAAEDVLNVYTLQGVKVNVNNVNELSKGLYIINGKKVLVK